MSRKTLSLLIALLFISISACSDDDTGGSKPKNDAGNTVDAGEDAKSDTDATDKDVTGPQCQSDQHCPDAPHQVGLCNSATHTCEYACDDGWADCNDDPSDGCEANILADTAHCGACGNTCEPDSTNFMPICVSQSDSSRCDIDLDRCMDGFKDLNGKSSDGCECEITDADDPIDTDGLDENCDGVDGILSNTVFITATGDDTVEDAGLTPENPVTTLQKALDIAATEGRSTILMAGGDYEGAVTLESGVSIYGGYADDFSSRDALANPTKILAKAADFDDQTTTYITLIADDLSDETILDHLTIVGFDAINPGASTLAIRAKNSPNLHIQNSTILAGTATDGGNGNNGEAPACTAPEGGKGGKADPDAKPCTDPGFDEQSAQRGRSGTYTGSDQNIGIGGDGGKHQCNAPATDGEDGENGTPGKAGNHGKLPAADTIGAFDAAGNWTPAAGTEPTAGGDGGGGGGGGAGGNYEASPGVDFYLGGNGGKGGDGGCGGTAGQNGRPGGSSFGIVVIGEAIAITDTTINLGHAGNGGEGGVGTQGEIGSEPVLGDPRLTNNSGSGGRGGAGGPGGKGGNGAGGQGGSSIGLATVGVDLTLDDSVTLNTDTGQKGTGGSATAPAENGRDGKLEGEIRID